jgi:hypothetical protein
MELIKEEFLSWVQVAQACNPATQEADIREITVRSQPQTNSSPDPISKILIIKKAGRVAQPCLESVNPRVQTLAMAKKKV